MDNISMSEEEYKALYNRIKTDLYNEFINPETATYGLDVVRQQETKQNKFAHLNDMNFNEREIIKEEIQQLEMVLKKYEEAEEYEHAAFMKKRIENLKKKL
jgi:protein-arginine kinase activator protein McsA